MPNTYRIDVTKLAEESLDQIFNYKFEHSEHSAWDFFDGFFLDIRKLSTLPHRGFNIYKTLKGRVYKEHTIIYTISENDNIVSIVDIVDPKQDTKASKYY